MNRKSREPKVKDPDRLSAPVQQAIWIVPIDDTRCEEMRLTVYAEPPKDKRYHGAFQDRARQRERKPYDRRFFGDITGIVPLEDKAMVESQGAIVDRTREHPGYGDRAILLLRKMIREGVADVANGKKPRGVLQEEIPLIDLDIGFEELEIDKVPEDLRDLLNDR
jgi:hypothetical protein